MDAYGDDDLLYLHGFVYSLDREDGMKLSGGICLEGNGRDRKWRESEGNAPEMFQRFFGDANQFQLDPPYAWYD